MPKKRQETLMVRIDGPLVDQIDKVKPAIAPREPYIRELIRLALKQTPAMKAERRRAGL